MNRQIRQLILMGVCTLALSLGWAGLALTKPEPPMAEAQEESGIILTSMDKKAVTQVVTANASGGYTSIWTDGEPGIAGLEGIELRSEALRNLKQATTALKAVEQIPDGAAHLADYGLAEPVATAVIREKDQEYTLSFGDVVPGVDTASRYCMMDGEVYMVYETMAKPFLWTATDFVSDQVTPSYDSSSQQLVVSRIRLETRGADAPVQVDFNGSTQLSGYTVNTYRLSSPVEYNVDTAILDNFLASPFNLKAERVAVVGATAEEMDAWGLTNPWGSLEVDYKLDGVEDSFSLICSEPENGSLYVMSQREGNGQIIYQCSVTGLSTLNYDAAALMSKEILIPNVSEVAAMEVSYDLDRNRGQHKMMLDAADGQELSVKVDGQLVDSTYFRNFYYTVISMSADQVDLADSVKKPEEQGWRSVGKIEYSYRTVESKDVLDIYEIDGQKLYILLNQGERGFEIQATKFSQVIAALEHLAAGEAVEARF